MTAIAASGPADTSWRDGKRLLWPLGLLVPTIPWIAWGLAAATGWGVAWWAGPILVFGVFPFFDWAIGKDSDNPPDSVLAFLEAQRYYRWCTYLYLPLQYAGLVTAAWIWSTGRLDTIDAVGLAVSVGTVGGIGINTAHELGHKKDELERWLSKVALAQTLYGHFYIEHNRGHHVRVATPEDPASSRLGESFYRFWPRSVAGSFRSGWHLEKARLERMGRKPWTLRNDVLNAWAMSLAGFGALIAVFGVRIVPFLLIQAVFGFSLLEVVNYLEHYGLLRQRNGERYERCAPRHSWNSNNIASNVLLYHLQRHSDHHANPTRRYQALRHFDDAPELPSGYATMIVLAYVTPLWRRVMDPKVVAHYSGDVTLANLQPRKREKLIAKYGARV
ncbi:alkane 1-monooxygenase [Catenulispora subtropica]|uniref:Fatty acid desaturase n=1 Tax=Catenulispora subtropica TaxID=450798 RepID=A0ABN2RH95_9ACTN